MCSEPIPVGNRITNEQALLRAMFVLGAYGDGPAATAVEIQAKIDYWIAEAFLEKDGDGFVITPDGQPYFDDVLAKAREARRDRKCEREDE